MFSLYHFLFSLIIIIPFLFSLNILLNKFNLLDDTENQFDQIVFGIYDLFIVLYIIFIIFYLFNNFIYLSIYNFNEIIYCLLVYLFIFKIFFHRIVLFFYPWTTTLDRGWSCPRSFFQIRGIRVNEKNQIKMIISLLFPTNILCDTSKM